MNCPTCGVPTLPWSHGSTMVGPDVFTDEQGQEHEHDPNCISHGYFCVNEHAWREWKQQTCAVPGCTWKGKLTCFCHEGPKVSEWTDALVSDEG